jgi:hypothetical protein
MVIMHVMMKDVNHVLVVWVVLDHHVIFIQVNVNVNQVLVEGKKRDIIE